MVFILGWLVETLRRMVFHLYSSIPAYFWITAHFHEEDSSYEWMMIWLSQQPSWAKARDVDVSTNTFGLRTAAIMVPGEETENDLSLLSSRQLAYLPAPTLTSSMWYRGRYMVITRHQAQTGYRGSKEETLKISILTRHHRVLNELLLEAKKNYMDAAEDKISIYVSDTSNNWSHVASRPKRKLNSIILDPGVSELLVEDAQDFLKSKAWYAARGIPFRRGYLLYGAPGSGKTSIISSIAGELGLNIYIVSLSRAGLDDSALSTLISDLPEKCIALMEDIDAAFTTGLNREADQAPANMNPPADAQAQADTDRPPPPDAPREPPTGRLSLSGLLNALDGIAAQEGRLLYATTNKYTALDPALCRPGRMDIHVEFHLASKFQAEKLFFAFYLPPDEEGERQQQQQQNAEARGGAAASAPSSSAAAPLAAADGGDSAKKPVYFGKQHRERAPKLSRPQVAALSVRFAEAIPAREVSMAALQGFLMGYKSRPREAVDAVPGWVEGEREARARAGRGV
ncbi:BCS1 N terminal-domain-containing protein [Mycena galericulata]|nr:BCS1 N terminal-domain-containing protein [Mycena galericulata]